MKPTKKYLEKLIKTTQQRFSVFEVPDLDLSMADITYCPTKKRFYMGIKAGIDGLAKMKKYKVKESPTIRANCTSYHKFYRINGKLVKFETFNGGHDRLDNYYLAYYEENYRYLFPFHGDQKATGLYIYVTHFKNETVIEEYMVSQNNQIVYDKYDYLKSGKVNHYSINYVPTGKYPVLAESKGYFFSDTLEYVAIKNYVWYQDL